MNEKRESVKILEECIDLQSKKSADYQADVSEIKQAEYYPHGVTTIYDIMHAKMLRIKSVLAKMEAGHDANFESVEDSCKDLINYSSFMVSYLRGKMDGQVGNRDAFNRPMKPGPYMQANPEDYKDMFDRLKNMSANTSMGMWPRNSKVDF